MFTRIGCLTTGPVQKQVTEVCNSQLPLEYYISTQANTHVNVNAA